MEKGFAEPLRAGYLEITRKLTFDYGLRWDYAGQGHEIHYRTSMFGPTIANPTIGGRLGGIVYEGYGPGRCDCQFTDTYQFALGPRLGIAYQLNSKTVVRAGWGITYSPLANWWYVTGGTSLGVGFNDVTFSTPAYAQPAYVGNRGAWLEANDLNNLNAISEATLSANGLKLEQCRRSNVIDIAYRLGRRCSARV